MDPDVATSSKKPAPQDIYYLESIEQLEAISDPIRFHMYSLLEEEPRTGAQLARALGISRARAHYHLNVLKEVGLVMFSREKLSPHGMTEKYYRGVAEHLDFSNLIPKGRQAPEPSEETLRSFKAAIRFVANLLEASREGIAHLKVHDGLGIGYHYILNSKLTQDQFQVVKEELIGLKNRIIEMEHENERSDESPPLVSCRTTLFLTPVSTSPSETEGINADNNDETNEQRNTTNVAA